MPYLVRDGESGFLVDPLDPTDIAARLCELLANDDLRVEMGARSREIARDRFHPERIALRTRAVYRRAVREH
jgi:glycosyltransferase involved in cell wall biosynthesis